jgi:hypothetical protein
MQGLPHLRPEDRRWTKLIWNEILEQALMSPDQDSINRASEFAVLHEAHAAEAVAIWKHVAERLEAQGEPAVGLALLYVANDVVLALAKDSPCPGSPNGDPRSTRQS